MPELPQCMRGHACRIPESTQAVASFLAKANGVLAGLYVAEKVRIHGAWLRVGACMQGTPGMLVLPLPLHGPQYQEARLNCCSQVFAAVDPDVRIHWMRRDGDAVTKGTVFGEVHLQFLPCTLWLLHGGNTRSLQLAAASNTGSELAE